MIIKEIFNFNKFIILINDYKRFYLIQCHTGDFG